MLSRDKQGKKGFYTAIKWLMGSAVLAVASVGSLFAYGLWQNQPPKSIGVRIIPVKLGTIEILVNESGILELGGQQTLKSPDEGAVEQVLVAVGDRVTVGQSVLSLRNPEQKTSLTKKTLEIEKQQLTLENQRQQVATAQEKLAFAKAELEAQIRDRTQKERQGVAKWKLEIHKQEITLARSHQKVIEAQEKLTAARQELKSQEELYTKGFIPAQEVKKVQEKVRMAETDLRQSQSDVSLQTADLQRFQLPPDLNLPSIDATKVPSAESELRKAQLEMSTVNRDLLSKQLEYQETKQKLQNNLLTAPINGKVLSIEVKAGEGIKRGDKLLTLGDPAQEIVKLQLSTLDAAKVQPNQEARIAIIGPNAKPFTDRVQNLYLLASTEASSDQSSRSNNQSSPAAVPAIVKLNQPTGTLIPGSQVNVEIVVQQRQNVVVLNTEAVQRSQSKPFVWVKDAQGRAQKQPVTLGLEGVTQVEIKAGLRPGQNVVLPPTEPPLQPGTPLKELETHNSP